jgi:hypothetical protein
MYQVIINFEEEEDARNFISWMDNQGEQDYWQAIEDMTGKEGVRSFEYGKYWEGELIINTTKE